ncbi:MAG: heparan-alpha-glucosaminide N-acetyltransferase [Candidatus Diapherotrites archaeon]|nr:heparan-alpha-glucosaminide N-acetyltransferase [Candidatus Diapherotrites archaeon]
MNSDQQRFFELDLLRGIAIILMIVFHFFFDLNYFGILQNEMYQGFWLIFQRTTASLFLLLVGISLSISYSKSSKFQKFFKRAITLFGIGLLITLVTWIYPGKGFIVFGIIHLIAVSILLSYFFQKFYKLNLIFGLAILALGTWIGLNSITLSIPWLLWAGLPPVNFYTLDYFPIFPWFGIILIGMFIGKTIYPNGKRKFELREPNTRLAKGMQWLGKQSLMIYLIHQPTIIGILYLVGLI